MIIPLKSFTGEFPRTNAALLPDNAAQYSSDCDFLAGSLQGMQGRKDLNLSGTGIKSMFFFKGGTLDQRAYWWNRDVDAVASPIVNDAHSRFYWADGTNFYVSQGNVGGNGEPATGNRWKVGVPRPGGLGDTTASASFSLGGTTFTGPNRLYDERSDGYLENSHEIGSRSWAQFTITGTTAKFSFTARASQPVDGVSSSTSTKKTAAAGDWLLRPKKVAVSGVDMPTYYKKGSPNTIIIYYTPTGSDLYPSQLEAVTIPAAAAVTTEDDDGSSRTVTPAVAEKKKTFYRLSQTSWYGTEGNIDPPYVETLGTQKWLDSKINAPFSGPCVRMVFTNAKQERVGEAYIRTDRSKTTWPASLPGYGAHLEESSGTYTVVISPNEDRVVTRYYVYTYVNAFGEEGPPSSPVGIECGEYASVTIPYAPPPTDYYQIDYVRLYRTATGTSTAFLYVPCGTYDVNGGFSVSEVNGFPVKTPYTITDNVKQTELGEALSTTNYYPPAQDLRGLCAMSNGMLVGFRDNEVHFMEPYLPYACNPSAIKPLPSRVTGICPFESGLYVTTIDKPYYLMGTTPDTMTDAKLTAVQAGVSKNSILNMGQYVAYASNDGIVMARGLDASLDKSFQFFTRGEWRERYAAVLDKMHLSVHDGSLVAWFDNGAQASDGSYGFLMRIEEEAPSLTRLTDPITAAYVHPQADQLYVSNGTRIYAFRADTARHSFTWWSKDFVMPKPTNFGVLQLIGTGSLAVKVYADGAEKLSTSVTLSTTGATLLRLPSGFMARRWSVWLSGSAEVNEMNIASTITELQSV